jgi:catechol 2,3-dioxygenase-like lactoylglutathione lyase family enzyme
MEVQSLGYVGVGAADLSEWTDFATNWLGMQMVERGNVARAFRMDDRKQRLIVDRSLAEGDRYFGWEVADAAALDALAARLDAAGVAVHREPATLADQRFVRGLISSPIRPATGWRLSMTRRSPTRRSRRGGRFPDSVPGRWGWGTRCST